MKNMSVRKGSDLPAREFVKYFLRTRPGLVNTLSIPLDQALNETVDWTFTLDQLAWMRVEQSSGYKYAAADKDGSVYLYYSKPVKDEAKGTWNINADNESYSEPHDGFLTYTLGWTDDEPLCFAHYTGVGGPVT